MKKSFLKTCILLVSSFIFVLVQLNFSFAQDINQSDTVLQAEQGEVSILQFLAPAAAGYLGTRFLDKDNPIRKAVDNTTNVGGFVADKVAQSTIMPLIQTASVFVLKMIQFAMWATGGIFDLVLKYTIEDQSFFLKLYGSITISWTIVRDIANIIIVFSLLYLGIKTILNGNGFAETRVLISIIIAAILINFSLVITRTVFDISNLIGSQIAQQIVFEGQSTGYGGVKTISEGLMGMIRPDSIMNIMWNDMAQSGWTVMWDRLQSAFITGFIMIFMVLIFLGASILLMYRFLIFIVLMITSPIGITSRFIPWFEEMGKSWWTHLKKQAIVLPAFLITLYISILFVVILSQNLSGAAFNIGSGSTVSKSNVEGAIVFFFNYFLIIGFLLLPLIVPGKLGAAGAGAMTGFADWTTKKIKNMPRRTLQRTAQVGASGVARSGRYLIGNKLASGIGGNTKEKREALQEKARSGNLVERTRARAQLKASESLKNKSYDIRNTNAVKNSEFGKGMGKGIENYTSAIKTKEKAFNDRKEKEMKLFGYDKLHETDENKIKIMDAEKTRKEAEELLTEHKNNLKFARESGASQSDIMDALRYVTDQERVLKLAETEVGRLKNIGTEQYVETDSQLLTRRVENFISSTSRDTLKKVREENKKKWEKDGQSSGKKRQRAEDNWVNSASSGTGTPIPPPPATPPPTPPTPTPPPTT